MDEENGTGLRLLLGGILAMIVVGGTIDLILDAPATWLSFHVLFELGMVAAALVSATALWLGWWRAREAVVAMARSLDAGSLVEIPDVPTLADGLAGQIDDHGLEIGRRFLDAIALVSEGELAEAIRWLWVHEQVRAEGAGAVGVAALLAGRLTSHGPLAMVVSGGNIDADRLAAILAGGVPDA